MYRRYFFTFVIMVLLCAGCISCGVQADTADESTATESDVSTLISGSAADCDVIRMLSFDGYREYLDFIREATPESINADLYGVYCFGDKAIADILAIQNAKEGVLVPCYKGTPIALYNYYEPISVTDGGWFYLTNTEFFVHINDQSAARVILTRLSDKYQKMADNASCAELISAISPSAVNVDNYRDYESELLVYEDTAVIDGILTSLMVRQTVYGDEMIYFVTKGYLVVIDVRLGVITPEWLGEFSLGTCSEN